MTSDYPMVTVSTEQSPDLTSDMVVVYSERDFEISFRSVAESTVTGLFGQ